MNRPQHLYITGIDGFVGRHLAPQLLAQGHRITAAVRTLKNPIPGVNYCDVGDISDSHWQPSLHGVDAVIHLAARVHHMHEATQQRLQRYRTANLKPTQTLAQAAYDAGVQRFIYLSSIKVLGEHSGPTPFDQHSAAQPCDAYAQSKWEAEQFLNAHPINSVIIRPPLIYGPGAKGNLHTLLQWLCKQRPLPLACINNQRSLVAIDNLCSLLAHCLHHPKACNQTFLVSDGHDFSTPELIHALAQALAQPARLWPLPPSWLKCLATLAGKRALFDRLQQSLTVDSRFTQDCLGWQPPQSPQQALSAMARAHQRSMCTP